MTSAAVSAPHDDVRGGFLARATAGLVPFAPAILRVPIGFIFLVYGYNKLPNPAGFEQFLASLGMPAPQILAPLVIGLELIGGAALIIGLLVRPVALLLAIEMVVTMLTVKLDLGIAPRGGAEEVSRR